MKKSFALIGLLMVCFLAAGCGADLVVDSAGDEPDINLSDGDCKTVNNDCTLRAAIMEANVSDDISKISFASNLTISPATNLPPLTVGNTQIRGGGHLIFLDGSQNTEYPQHGIQILDSHNNTIQGLKISNFLYGIHIYSDAGESFNNIIGMSPSSSNGSDQHNTIGNNYIGILIEGHDTYENIVSGNYIGADSDGVTALPNEYDGVQIREEAHHNLIGSRTGTTVSTGGNLVSGNGIGIKIDDNSHHNLISGNYIGTQESGNIALSNGAGIKIQRGSNNNIIGVDTSGEGQPNLISGNTSDGIVIYESDFSIISGNLIGTNSTGDSAIPNRFGIYLNLSSNNIIGTDGNGINDANEGNLISGNTRTGIAIYNINSIVNTIAGNKIGTNFNGTSSLGNGKNAISSAGAYTIIGTNGDGKSDDLEGNLLSGNEGYGILLSSFNNQVSGNIIGLDITGASAIGNSLGIYLNSECSQNLIGTNGDGTSDNYERNIISGNENTGFPSTKGIYLMGSTNTIAGNFIGPDISGTTALSPDQIGIYVDSSTTNNFIGTNSDGNGDTSESNLISGNGWLGIDIQGGAYNAVAGNLIGTDINGTSALPNGFSNSDWQFGAIRLEDATQTVIGTNGDGIQDQVEGNLISGNAITGIVVAGENSFNNVIAGNRIGTDLTGSTALGNTVGIDIQHGPQHTRIGSEGLGGANPAESNIISGNGEYGIRVDSPASFIFGNFIGTDQSGTVDIGNGDHGILILNNALGVAVGSTPSHANTIAFNQRAGIYVRQYFQSDPIPSNVIISANSIFSNGEEGIDLDDGMHSGSTPNDLGDMDSGPNDYLNYPTLNSAQSITPTLAISGEVVDGLPNTQFEIQFFSNTACDSPSNHGEGKNYLGSTIVNTDNSGNAQFLVSYPANVSPGSSITATATTSSKTSEFSECIEVQEAQTYSQEEDPCDQFDPDQMAITTFNFRPESGQFILYVKNSGPFPVFTPNNTDWEYYGKLGELSTQCGFESFDDRIYCYLKIPESYLNSTQIFQMYSNICIPPFFIDEVSIVTKNPTGPTGPDAENDPQGCHSGLSERDCIANGGNYSEGVCICPRRNP